MAKRLNKLMALLTVFLLVLNPLIVSAQDSKAFEKDNPNKLDAVVDNLKISGKKVLFDSAAALKNELIDVNTDFVTDLVSQGYDIVVDDTPLSTDAIAALVNDASQDYIVDELPYPDIRLAFDDISLLSAEGDLLNLALAEFREKCSGKAFDNLKELEKSDATLGEVVKEIADIKAPGCDAASLNKILIKIHEQQKAERKFVKRPKYDPSRPKQEPIGGVIDYVQWGNSLTTQTFDFKQDIESLFSDEEREKLTSGEGLLDEVYSLHSYVNNLKVNTLVTEINSLFEERFGQEQKPADWESLDAKISAKIEELKGLDSELAEDFKKYHEDYLKSDEMNVYYTELNDIVDKMNSPSYATSKFNSDKTRVKQLLDTLKEEDSLSEDAESSYLNFLSNFNPNAKNLAHDKLNDKMQKASEGYTDDKNSLRELIGLVEELEPIVPLEEKKGTAELTAVLTTMVGDAPHNDGEPLPAEVNGAVLSLIDKTNSEANFVSVGRAFGLEMLNKNFDPSDLNKPSPEQLSRMVYFREEAKATNLFEKLFIKSQIANSIIEKKLSLSEISQKVIDRKLKNNNDAGCNFAAGLISGLSLIAGANTELLDEFECEKVNVLEPFMLSENIVTAMPPRDPIDFNRPFMKGDPVAPLVPFAIGMTDLLRCPDIDNDDVCDKIDPNLEQPMHIPAEDEAPPGVPKEEEPEEVPPVPKKEEEPESPEDVPVSEDPNTGEADVDPDILDEAIEKEPPEEEEPIPDWIVEEVGVAARLIKEDEEQFGAGKQGAEVNEKLFDDLVGRVFKIPQFSMDEKKIDYKGPKPAFEGAFNSFYGAINQIPFYYGTNYKALEYHLKDSGGGAKAPSGKTGQKIVTEPVAVAPSQPVSIGNVAGIDKITGAQFIGPQPKLGGPGAEIDCSTPPTAVVEKAMAEYQSMQQVVDNAEAAYRRGEMSEAEVKEQKALLDGLLQNIAQNIENAFEEYLNAEGDCVLYQTGTTKLKEENLITYQAVKGYVKPDSQADYDHQKRAQFIHDLLRPAFCAMQGEIQRSAQAQSNLANNPTVRESIQNALDTAEDKNGDNKIDLKDIDIDQVIGNIEDALGEGLDTEGLLNLETLRENKQLNNLIARMLQAAIDKELDKFAEEANNNAQAAAAKQKEICEDKGGGPVGQYMGTFGFLGSAGAIVAKIGIGEELYSPANVFYSLASLRLSAQSIQTLTEEYKEHKANLENKERYVRINGLALLHNVGYGPALLPPECGGKASVSTGMPASNEDEETEEGEEEEETEEGEEEIGFVREGLGWGEGTATTGGTLDLEKPTPSGPLGKTRAATREMCKDPAEKLIDNILENFKAQQKSVDKTIESYKNQISSEIKRQGLALSFAVNNLGKIKSKIDKVIQDLNGKISAAKSFAAFMGCEASSMPAEGEGEGEGIGLPSLGMQEEVMVLPGVGLSGVSGTGFVSGINAITGAIPIDPGAAGIDVMAAPAAPNGAGAPEPAGGGAAAGISGQLAVFEKLSNQEHGLAVFDYDITLNKKEPVAKLGKNYKMGTFLCGNAVSALGAAEAAKNALASYKAALGSLFRELQSHSMFEQELSLRTFESLGLDHLDSAMAALNKFASKFYGAANKAVGGFYSLGQFWAYASEFEMSYSVQHHNNFHADFSVAPPPECVWVETGGPFTPLPTSTGEVMVIGRSHQTVPAGTGAVIADVSGKQVFTPSPARALRFTEETIITVPGTLDCPMCEQARKDAEAVQNAKKLLSVAAAEGYSVASIIQMILSGKMKGDSALEGLNLGPLKYDSDYNKLSAKDKQAVLDELRDLFSFCDGSAEEPDFCDGVRDMIDYFEGLLKINNINEKLTEDLKNAGEEKRKLGEKLEELKEKIDAKQDYLKELQDKLKKVKEKIIDNVDQLGGQAEVQKFKKDVEKFAAEFEQCKSQTRTPSECVKELKVKINSKAFDNCNKEDSECNKMLEDLKSDLEQMKDLSGMIDSENKDLKELNSEYSEVNVEFNVANVKEGDLSKSAYDRAKESMLELKETLPKVLTAYADKSIKDYGKWATAWNEVKDKRKVGLKASVVQLLGAASGSKEDIEDAMKRLKTIDGIDEIMKSDDLKKLTNAMENPSGDNLKDFIDALKDTKKAVDGELKDLQKQANDLRARVIAQKAMEIVGGLLPGFGIEKADPVLGFKLGEFDNAVTQLKNTRTALFGAIPNILSQIDEEDERKDVLEKFKGLRDEFKDLKNERDSVSKEMDEIKNEMNQIADTESPMYKELEAKFKSLDVKFKELDTAWKGIDGAYKNAVIADATTTLMQKMQTAEADDPLYVYVIIKDYITRLDPELDADQIKQVLQPLIDILNKKNYLDQTDDKSYEDSIKKFFDEETSWLKDIDPELRDKIMSVAGELGEQALADRKFASASVLIAQIEMFDPKNVDGLNNFMNEIKNAMAQGFSFYDTPELMNLIYNGLAVSYDVFWDLQGKEVDSSVIYNRISEFHLGQKFLEKVAGISGQLLFLNSNMRHDGIIPTLEEAKEKGMADLEKIGIIYMDAAGLKKELAALKKLMSEMDPITRAMKMALLYTKQGELLRLCDNALKVTTTQAEFDEVDKVISSILVGLDKSDPFIKNEVDKILDTRRKKFADSIKKPSELTNVQNDLTNKIELLGNEMFKTKIEIKLEKKKLKGLGLDSASEEAMSLREKITALEDTYEMLSDDLNFWKEQSVKVNKDLDNYKKDLQDEKEFDSQAKNEVKVASISQKRSEINNIEEHESYKKARREGIGNIKELDKDGQKDLTSLTGKLLLDLEALNHDIDAAFKGTAKGSKESAIASSFDLSDKLGKRTAIMNKLTEIYSKIKPDHALGMSKESQKYLDNLHKFQQLASLLDKIDPDRVAEHNYVTGGISDDRKLEQYAKAAFDELKQNNDFSSIYLAIATEGDPVKAWAEILNKDLRKMLDLNERSEAWSGWGSTENRLRGLQEQTKDHTFLLQALAQSGLAQDYPFFKLVLENSEKINMMFEVLYKDSIADNFALDETSRTMTLWENGNEEYRKSYEYKLVKAGTRYAEEFLTDLINYLDGTTEKFDTSKYEKYHVKAALKAAYEVDPEKLEEKRNFWDNMFNVHTLVADVAPMLMTAGTAGAVGQGVKKAISAVLYKATAKKALKNVGMSALKKSAVSRVVSSQLTKAFGDKGLWLKVIGKKAGDLSKEATEQFAKQISKYSTKGLTKFARGANLVSAGRIKTIEFMARTGGFLAEAATFGTIMHTVNSLKQDKMGITEFFPGLLGEIGHSIMMIGGMKFAGGIVQPGVKAIAGKSTMSALETAGFRGLTGVQLGRHLASKAVGFGAETFGMGFGTMTAEMDFSKFGDGEFWLETASAVAQFKIGHVAGVEAFNKLVSGKVGSPKVKIRDYLQQNIERGRMMAESSRKVLNNLKEMPVKKFASEYGLPKAEAAKLKKQFYENSNYKKLNKEFYKTYDKLSKKQKTAFLKAKNRAKVNAQDPNTKLGKARIGLEAAKKTGDPNIIRDASRRFGFELMREMGKTLKMTPAMENAMRKYKNAEKSFERDIKGSEYDNMFRRAEVINSMKNYAESINILGELIPEVYETINSFSKDIPLTKNKYLFDIVSNMRTQFGKTPELARYQVLETNRLRLKERIKESVSKGEIEKARSLEKRLVDTVKQLDKIKRNKKLKEIVDTLTAETNTALETFLKDKGIPKERLQEFVDRIKADPTEIANIEAEIKETVKEKEKIPEKIEEVKVVEEAPVEITPETAERIGKESFDLIKTPDGKPLTVKDYLANKKSFDRKLNLELNNAKRKGKEYYDKVTTEIESFKKKAELFETIQKIPTLKGLELKTQLETLEKLKKEIKGVEELLKPKVKEVPILEPTIKDKGKLSEKLDVDSILANGPEAVGFKNLKQALTKEVGNFKDYKKPMQTAKQKFETAKKLYEKNSNKVNKDNYKETMKEYNEILKKSAQSKQLEVINKEFVELQKVKEKVQTLKERVEKLKEGKKKIKAKQELIEAENAVKVQTEKLSKLIETKDFVLEKTSKREINNMIDLIEIRQRELEYANNIAMKDILFKAREGQLKRAIDNLLNDRFGFEFPLAGGKTTTIAPLTLEIALELYGRKGLFILPEGKSKDAASEINAFMKYKGRKVATFNPKQSIEKQLKKLLEADHIVATVNDIGFLMTKLRSPGLSKAEMKAVKTLVEALTKDRQTVFDEIHITGDPKTEFIISSVEGIALPKNRVKIATDIAKALENMKVLTVEKGIDRSVLEKKIESKEEGVIYEVGGNKFNEKTMNELIERVAGLEKISAENVKDIFKNANEYQKNPEKSPLNTKQTKKLLEYLDQINSFADFISKFAETDYAWSSEQGRTVPSKEGNAQPNQQFSKAGNALAAQFVGAIAYAKESGVKRIADVKTEAMKVGGKAVKGDIGDFLAMQGKNTGVNVMTGTGKGVDIIFESRGFTFDKSFAVEEKFLGHGKEKGAIEAERFILEKEGTILDVKEAVDMINEKYKDNGEFSKSKGMDSNGNLMIELVRPDMIPTKVMEQLRAGQFGNHKFLIRTNEGVFKLYDKNGKFERVLETKEAGEYYLGENVPPTVTILGQGGTVGTNVLMKRNIPHIQIGEYNLGRVTRSLQEQSYGRAERIEGEIPDIWTIVTGAPKEMSKVEFREKYIEQLEKNQNLEKKNALKQELERRMEKSAANELFEIIDKAPSESQKELARKVLQEMQNKDFGKLDLEMKTGLEATLESMQKRAESVAEFYKELMTKNGPDNLYKEFRNSLTPEQLKRLEAGAESIKLEFAGKEMPIDYKATKSILEVKNPKEFEAWFKENVYENMLNKETATGLRVETPTMKVEKAVAEAAFKEAPKEFVESTVKEIKDFRKQATNPDISPEKRAEGERSAREQTAVLASLGFNALAQGEVDAAIPIFEGMKDIYADSPKYAKAHEARVTALKAFSKIQEDLIENEFVNSDGTIAEKAPEMPQEDYEKIVLPYFTTKTKLEVDSLKQLNEFYPVGESLKLDDIRTDIISKLEDNDYEAVSNTINSILAKGTYDNNIKMQNFVADVMKMIPTKDFEQLREIEATVDKLEASKVISEVETESSANVESKINKLYDEASAVLDIANMFQNAVRIVGVEDEIKLTAFVKEDKYKALIKDVKKAYGFSNKEIEKIVSEIDKAIEENPEIGQQINAINNLRRDRISKIESIVPVEEIEIPEVIEEVKFFETPELGRVEEGQTLKIGEREFKVISISDDLKTVVVEVAGEEMETSPEGLSAALRQAEVAVREAKVKESQAELNKINRLRSNRDRTFSEQLESIVKFSLLENADDQMIYETYNDVINPDVITAGDWVKNIPVEEREFGRFYINVKFNNLNDIKEALAEKDIDIEKMNYKYDKSKAKVHRSDYFIISTIDQAGFNKLQKALKDLVKEHDNWFEKETVLFTNPEAKGISSAQSIGLMSPVEEGAYKGKYISEILNVPVKAEFKDMKALSFGRFMSGLISTTIKENKDQSEKEIANKILEKLIRVGINPEKPWLLFKKEVPVVEKPLEIVPEVKVKITEKEVIDDLKKGEVGFSIFTNKGEYKVALLKDHAVEGKDEFKGLKITAEKGAAERGNKKVVGVNENAYERILTRALAEKMNKNWNLLFVENEDGSLSIAIGFELGTDVAGRPGRVSMTLNRVPRAYVDNLLANPETINERIKELFNSAKDITSKQSKSEAIQLAVGKIFRNAISIKEIDFLTSREQEGVIILDDKITESEFKEKLAEDVLMTRLKESTARFKKLAEC